MLDTNLVIIVLTKLDLVSLARLLLPPAAIACNIAQGACMASCAVCFLAPTP
nr:8332_t:CDS:2 [Entrophospora candida]